MEKWENSNLIVKNESLEYILQRLAYGEATASTQYRMAYIIRKSEGVSDDDFLLEHFKEHEEDEWKHYQMLAEYLASKGLELDLDIQGMSDKALPPTVELEDTDSESLAEFFFAAEQDAVDTYLEVFDQVRDVELAKIIKSIIADEEDHEGDFAEYLEDYQ